MLKFPKFNWAAVVRLAAIPMATLHGVASATGAEQGTPIEGAPEASGRIHPQF